MKSHEFPMISTWNHQDDAAFFRACRVKDYYLRRAESFDWSPEECRALLEAALEIDAANASVPGVGAVGVVEVVGWKNQIQNWDDKSL